MKLARKGLAREQVAAALDDLSAAGLQDDRRYADSYVTSRAGRGCGPRRIARELEQRGLAPAAVAQALAAAGCDWNALAGAALRKKFRAPATTAIERARQTRFMEYRGFTPEQIRHALGSSAHDEDV